MDMFLRNYTEEEVRSYLDKEYPKTDICQCDGCRLDVMALMLNNMAPHYVVSDTGQLYAQMEDFNVQHKIDLMTIMADAVRMVKKRPRHAPASPSDKLR